MRNDYERYTAAAHAMQTGVAMEMEQSHTAKATAPKHLRVGINAAMVDHGGLVQLLIDKGVITEAEYLKTIADGMEKEVADYELRLSSLFGSTIKLA